MHLMVTKVTLTLAMTAAQLCGTLLNQRYRQGYVIGLFMVVIARYLLWLLQVIYSCYYWLFTVVIIGCLQLLFLVIYGGYYR